MADAERVVAVIVTWNRRELLAESLGALAAQSCPLDQVIVVDNASDDGTDELLARESAERDDLQTVRTTRNIGGAGGFALGIERALETGCDAVWLMDDDTVPEPTALERLLDARARYLGETPALVASRVVWTDGRDHPMNTPRRKPGASRIEIYAAEAIGCMPIRSASFVSVLIDADTVRDRGLPIADYFLWNDDFEFTTRIVRGLPALYCPASVVVHKTAMYGSTDVDPGDRFYFEVRNKVWLFGRSHGLSPMEKAVYGGSSLRRWARTITASRDRKTLLRAAGRGLVDGVRTKPRSTHDVISSAVPDEEDPGSGSDG